MRLRARPSDRSVKVELYRRYHDSLFRWEARADDHGTTVFGFGITKRGALWKLRSRLRSREERRRRETAGPDEVREVEL